MRRKLFVIGAILTTIGAAVSTFATFFLYFYLLPLWVFLAGIVLIWLSDKRTKAKILWSLIPIAVFVAYQFSWHQFNKVPQETFLIPKDYKGKVHVHFNKECGQAAESERGRRLYKIPDHGILLTQFKDKQGFIDQQYYLVDENGTKTLLPQLDVRDYNEEWTLGKNPKEPSRDILGVFHAGRVSGEGSYEFYVTTYRHLRDSFGFEYDKQFDSLEKVILDMCRKRPK